MERKFLRVSKKELIKMSAILIAIGVVMLLVTLFASEFDFEVLLEEDVLVSALIYSAVTVVYIGVYIYQYYSNVLEYGSYGFVAGGTTYSFSQVTKLVAVHRGRHGTYYHLYVGDSTVFRFSAMYENKDDFMMLLQKNGVPVVA